MAHSRVPRREERTFGALEREAYERRMRALYSEEDGSVRKHAAEPGMPEPLELAGLADDGAGVQGLDPSAVADDQGDGAHAVEAVAPSLGPTGPGNAPDLPRTGEPMRDYLFAQDLERRRLADLYDT